MAARAASPSITSPTVQQQQQQQQGLPPQRRLSSRRGSMAAVDPWGKHYDEQYSKINPAVAHLGLPSSGYPAPTLLLRKTPMAIRHRPVHMVAQGRSAIDPTSADLPGAPTLALMARVANASARV
ncbi:hypothetical protein BN14_03539 [Rhizoctonia solani AG-1 IB]|uniref:Uncharacterized protein n=1 Tax=Thanatephorus cucumeris (strain AG1-IB / isolate 7/3/14) TaxID=1108050 RepID=M5BSQ0_THACB|nr:hypothetical protein BN14_03539 [Rhizoctonia solani AG-1 IB]